MCVASVFSGLFIRYLRTNACICFAFIFLQVWAELLRLRQTSSHIRLLCKCCIQRSCIHNRSRTLLVSSEQASGIFPLCAFWSLCKVWQSCFCAIGVACVWIAPDSLLCFIWVLAGFFIIYSKPVSFGCPFCSFPLVHVTCLMFVKLVVSSPVFVFLCWFLVSHVISAVEFLLGVLRFVRGFRFLCFLLVFFGPL